MRGGCSFGLKATNLAVLEFDLFSFILSSFLLIFMNNDLFYFYLVFIFLNNRRTRKRHLFYL